MPRDSADALAFTGAEVQTQLYHTVDQTTEHHVGDVYQVSDYELYMTLFGCRFVRPTAWSSVASTGATAGTPGSWTPTGSNPPDSFTLMNTITASPATAWTSGQHVILGDNSHAFWNGVSWQSGNAP
jgi:hypothetical protein